MIEKLSKLALVYMPIIYYIMNEDVCCLWKPGSLPELSVLILLRASMWIIYVWINVLVHMCGDIISMCVHVHMCKASHGGLQIVPF